MRCRSSATAAAPLLLLLLLLQSAIRRNLSSSFTTAGDALTAALVHERGTEGKRWNGGDCDASKSIAFGHE